MENAILVLKLSKEAGEWVRQRGRGRVSSGLQFAHNIGMWIHEACTVSRKITFCFWWQLGWSLLASPESDAQWSKVRPDSSDSYECNT